MHQHFHIGPGTEAMPLLHQLCAQFAIVEDLSVAYQDQRTVFVVEGLIAATEVNQTQATEAESDVVL
jgi:hypothetical protein